jgi:hypothetical protein
VTSYQYLTITKRQDGGTGGNDVQVWVQQLLHRQQVDNLQIKGEESAVPQDIGVAPL